MEQISDIITDNIEIIQQGLRLIQSISDKHFSDAITPIAQSGVGAHFRHIWDHYHCFTQSLNNQTLNYDNRKRDKQIETNRNHCIEQFNAISQKLKTISINTLKQEIKVKMDTGHVSEYTLSSVARELQFLLSHTIHHYSVISLLLKTAHISVPDDFGVAPSTQKYQATLHVHAHAS